MNTSEVGQAAPRRTGRAVVAVGMVVLALGAAAVVLLLERQRTIGPAAQPTEVTAHAPALAGAQLEESVAPAARGRLPALGQSDDFMRELLAGLNGGAAYQAWLAGGDLARRVAALVSALSQGEVPRTQLAGFGPRGAFEVEERDGALFVDPRSHQRYDPAGALIVGLNAQRAAAAFQLAEPVLERAWREVAPPRQTLRQATARATAHLLAVEVPSGDVEVVEKGAVYAFADHRLEALSPAQKQLLRMGPGNARAVQGKLRELRAALGLPEAVR